MLLFNIKLINILYGTFMSIGRYPRLGLWVSV
jgi:hypothetical protein